MCTTFITPYQTFYPNPQYVCEAPCTPFNFTTSSHKRADLSGVLKANVDCSFAAFRWTRLNSKAETTRNYNRWSESVTVPVECTSDTATLRTLNRAVLLSHQLKGLIGWRRRRRRQPRPTLIHQAGHDRAAVNLGEFSFIIKRSNCLKFYWHLTVSTSGKSP